LAAPALERLAQPATLFEQKFVGENQAFDVGSG
jgi:hypothetical protein